MKKSKFSPTQIVRNLKEHIFIVEKDGQLELKYDDFDTFVKIGRSSNR